MNNFTPREDDVFTPGKIGGVTLPRTVDAVWLAHPAHDYGPAVFWHDENGPGRCSLTAFRRWARRHQASRVLR